jgi:tellurite resistance protein TerB
MFKGLKAKLGGSAKRISGRTDLLEAICAASALVAAADGDVADSEIDAAIKSVTSNEALSTAFSNTEITGCIEKMLDRANGGRVGRRALMKEIEDVTASPEEGEIVLLTALDIADADGTIDDDERKVLDNIATVFGLKVSSYE